MRIALGVSYQGGNYEGWQSQASGRTVQDQLELALSKFCNQPIRTLCAGRTDAGVHALMQVVHFDTQAARDDNAWVRGPNRFLPTDIAVQWAKPVPDALKDRMADLSPRARCLLALAAKTSGSGDAAAILLTFGILLFAAVVERGNIEVIIRVFHIRERVAHSAVPPQIILVIILPWVLLRAQEEHMFVEVGQSGTMEGIVEVSGADVDRGRLDVGGRVGNEQDGELIGEGDGTIGPLVGKRFDEIGIFG